NASSLSGVMVENLPVVCRCRKATPHKKLSTFFGVVIPTLLSMFGVVDYLQIAFMVGQCGLYQSIAMFIVAYLISMTVLSVSAITSRVLIGAHIYAKPTFLIFIIIMVVLATIFLSFFAVGLRDVTLPNAPGANSNATTGLGTANFTGRRLATLRGNL
ncbi:unnamed protein product, partial [Coregonus sp. 'balchen']